MTFTKTQAQCEWIFDNSVMSITNILQTPAVAETRTHFLLGLAQYSPLHLISP
jgi:hypothetical protein